MLRHDVRVGVGLAHHPGDRGDVDQGAAPLLPHGAQSCPGPVHGAHDVDVDDPAEILQRHVRERPEHGDRRGVDPYVDPPEPFHGTPCEVVDRLDVRDIGRDDERPGAPVPLAVARGGFEGLLSPRGQHHGTALARERHRGGPSDTARRPRDHHYRILDTHPAASSGITGEHRARVVPGPDLRLSQVPDATWRNQRRGVGTGGGGRRTGGGRKADGRASRPTATAARGVPCRRCAGRWTRPAPAGRPRACPGSGRRSVPAGGRGVPWSRRGRFPVFR